MASLQTDPSGNYHIKFRFGGRQFRRSLRTKMRRKAEAAASHVEENIRLILEGRMNLPSGADVPTFLLSDGKLAEPIKFSPDIQVGQLFEKYQLSIPNDTLEKTTLNTFGVHMRHIVRLIGGRQVLSGITKCELQKYVTARSNEPGRRGNISATTIRKELGTFGALWNWAKTEGFVDADFPRKGLLFPKQTNKPAFQTWGQIQKQISENGLTDSDAAPLWDCLYLDTTKVKALLDFIGKNSYHASLHPMCALAAYTGARRSELCRSETADIDLVGGVFTIQERKRSKSRRTTRTVPISDRLAEILEDWLAKKTASKFTFPECHRSLRLQKADREKSPIKPFEASNFLNAQVERMHVRLSLPDLCVPWSRTRVLLNRSL